MIGADPGGGPAADPADRRSARVSAVALVATALGGGLALLSAGRPWVTARVERPRPLPMLSVELTGRTVEAAVPGLAFVALAGLVALLATRGIVRRVVGGMIALSGLGLIVAAAAGVDPAAHRLRELVRAARTGVVLDAAAPIRISHHVVWPALSIAGGLLVLGGGLLATFGRAGWAGLGRRYEAPLGARTDAGPGSAKTEPAGNDLALWKSLDRGEDPTSRTQS